VEPLNRIFISIGPITIYWYAIFMISGAFLGYLLVAKQAEKEDINDDTILDLLLIAFPIAILSARTYYVLFEWSDYSTNFWDVFKIWEGGLAIHGGLIGAIITGYFFSKKRNIPFFKLADLVAPGILVGQIVGRWGNFMNQEAFGGIVPRTFLESLNLPNFIINQMYIDGAYHHPTFLYESLWNSLILIILLLVRNKKHFQGQLFFMYLMGYSIGRFFIEGLRTDSLMLTSTIRMAQFISVILIILSTVAMIGLARKEKKSTLLE
jgi:phosphatidylglycerol:prolipoprotein diacylglycerol transferase